MQLNGFGAPARDMGCDGSQHYSGAGMRGKWGARYSLSSIPPASASPELSHENLNPADKMRPSAHNHWQHLPRRLVKHHFTSGALKPVRPLVDLQQLPFSSVFLMFYFIFQHFEQPVPHCFMIFHGIQSPISMKEEQNKKMSHNDHVLKDIRIIAVKKEKMTEHADWTQHDRNSSKRVKQKWLFAENKYIPRPITHGPDTQDTFGCPSWKPRLCKPQLSTLFI